MRVLLRATFLVLFAVAANPADAQKWELPKLYVPFLENPPVIDGDLSEWKDYAHHDGIWDIYRLRHAPWYDDGRRNRLTDHGTGSHPEDDLRARYFMAWDDEYLYFGAEVVDNVNDVDDPNHAPHRWMFKDSICWFIEAPRTDAPKFFARGNNAFCFVADATYPDYGAWWRYGTPTETHQEAPIPPDAVDYALRFNPWGTGEADYVLEARVRMDAVFPVSEPDWQPPRLGDEYGLMIVHCDPDGGAYGGHFMIYGDGDDSSTWGRIIFSPPQRPIERRPQ